MPPQNQAESKRITALTREEILERAPELMQAAREFTRLANELCGQLAAKIGISTTQLSLCGRFLPPEIEFEQVGILNSEWKYFFHGIECGFAHRQSGQHLDVIFGFRDEFGDIGASFWHYFIETTPHYADLSSWLALGVHDVQIALDALTDAGLLVEIEGSPDFVFEVPGRRGCIVAPKFYSRSERRSPLRTASLSDRPSFSARKR